MAMPVALISAPTRRRQAAGRSSPISRARAKADSAAPSWDSPGRGRSDASDAARASTSSAARARAAARPRAVSSTTRWWARPVRPAPAPSAPASAGPYSPAARAGDWLALAGQVGIDPGAGRLVDGGAAAETRQALANVAAVLGD